jgi:hypothetical protein
VTPDGHDPSTSCFVGKRSIQLSYGVIRTEDNATKRRFPMPGKKKFGDDDEPDRDHCPKCGVKLTQGEKDSERCRNGHALS